MIALTALLQRTPHRARFMWRVSAAAALVVIIAVHALLDPAYGFHHWLAP